MKVSNNVNTYAQYPNLDQLTKGERGMFLKEHEFQAKLDIILAELTALTDKSAGSSNEIETKKQLVTEKLSNLTSLIENDLHDLVKVYVAEMDEDEREVAAAEERLDAKLRSIIQVLNVNLQNRTINYDVVVSYLSRVTKAAHETFGIKNPYANGENKKEGEIYTVKRNALIQLRDVNENEEFQTVPVDIDPAIDLKKDSIKICSFTPIPTGVEGELPSFLAEIIISGDLYAFKGFLSSASKNHLDGERTAVFEADYFINQDLPFAIKALYDKTNNKIVLAVTFDAKDDAFISIVKFDFSINLLVGENLHFSPNCTKINSIAQSTHSVRFNLINLTSDGNHEVHRKIRDGENVSIVVDDPVNSDDSEYTYELPNLDENPECIAVYTDGVRTYNYEWIQTSKLLIIKGISGPTSVTFRALKVEKLRG